MVVDEIILQDMIDKAYAKLDTIIIARSKLQKFISDCSEITMTPNVTNPKIKELPKDKILGNIITASRRLSIYDKLLLDKVKLGI